MQVILLEKIRKLGGLGEQVSVKNGYGRNYLVPQGKAIFATKENIEYFESRRAELEKKASADLAAAEKRAATLRSSSIVISAQASEEGKLYGSVGVNEIIDALQAKSLEVSKREVIMPEGPIHSVGEFEVEILVHSDVTAKLTIKVEAA